MMECEPSSDRRISPIVAKLEPLVTGYDCSVPQQCPSASSPLLERRAVSAGVEPSQPSLRRRCSDEHDVPSIMNLNRQLEDLSRDIKVLNGHCSEESIPRLSRTPLKPQPLQHEKQPQKSRLPLLNKPESARSASTPIRAGRQAPCNRCKTLPTVSCSPPRLRASSSFRRSDGNKSSSPTSIRRVNRQPTPHRISAAGSAACVEVTTPAAGCADDAQTEGKQGAAARTRGGRIRVVVRKRPLPLDENNADCVSMDPPNVKVAVRKQRLDLSEYADLNDFTFDDAYGEDKDNEYIFNSCCKELLATTLQGGSASCFAYGQTGSGKTHTMVGGEDERGLYILAAAEIFSSIEEDQEVYASLYEIYCNSLFDLLNNRSPVVVREDHNRRMQITGLTWHAVSSANELQLLISSGADQRSTGSTSANERSSRSHAVLTLQVRSRADSRFCGTLNLVDLAGSERAADTATTDRQTRQEGAEINKSLLALKECIRALDEKKRHVPFRGSKLTEILRDSFIGNSRTVMIANISASSQNCEHTLNTLRYAFRVKGLSIVNFEPSRARNVPRSLKPPVTDMLPGHGAAPPSVGPSRNSPVRKRAMSSGAGFHANPAAVNAPLSIQSKGQAVGPTVVTRRNISQSNTPQQQRCNASSPICGTLRGGVKGEDANFEDYIRTVTREKVLAILPQAKVGDSRQRDNSLKNDDSSHDTSSSFSFNHELMKELEDRVVEEMKSELSKSIKEAVIKRDRTIQRLRREKAMLISVVAELEKKMKECPHCKGQVA